MTGSSLSLGLLGWRSSPAALLVLVTGTVADRRPATAGGDRRPRRRRAPRRLRQHGSDLDAADLSARHRLRHRAFATPATRSLPADSMEPERQPWLTAAIGDVAGRADSGPGSRRLSTSSMCGCSSRDDFGRRAVVTVLGVLRPGRARRPSARATLRQAMEGLRFVRRQPVLLGAISLDLFAVCSAAPLPCRRSPKNGWGSAHDSAGCAPPSASALLGDATVRPVHRKVGRTLPIAALFGVGTIVLGFTTSFGRLHRADGARAPIR